MSAAPAAGLDARLVVERGGFVLDIDLRVGPGRVVALLGPNGAGKSTALRALAGLLPLAAGHIGLDGTCLDDAEAGVFVPAEKRPVGMVFQDYLLFPHLDLTENVAFGLRSRGVARRTAREEADRWLDRVGLGTRVRSRPAMLSGGQAQRVALARALAAGPRLLLLDEPLAALDAGTRLEVRAELRRHLADFGGTTVLVTHDPLDAMVLSTDLVVVEGGRVVQQGAPGDVARAPRTGYVARLVGLNLYQGSAAAGVVRLRGGGEIRVADDHDGAVFVAFPPSAVSLYRGRPEAGSPRNAWPGRVRGLEQHGHAVRIDVASEPPVLADVTPAAVAELGLTLGSEVWAAVKATETHAYPA